MDRPSRSRYAYFFEDQRLSRTPSGAVEPNPIVKATIKSLAGFLAKGDIQVPRCCPKLMHLDIRRLRIDSNFLSDLLECLRIRYPSHPNTTPACDSSAQGCLVTMQKCRWQADSQSLEVNDMSLPEFTHFLQGSHLP